MDDLGFFRVRAYVPTIKIGNPFFNGLQIQKALEDACITNVECIVFPELCITGYTCADLFQQEVLIKGAERSIENLLNTSKNFDLCYTVGAPIIAFGKMYNCAVFIYNGHILGIVPKSYMPNYGEFYEKRWFNSGKDIKRTNITYANQNVPFGSDLIFQYKGVKLGIEICEDLWIPQPPSSSLAMAGAEIILNLSASDDLIGKKDYLYSLISQQSARCRCGYVYSSAGWGESTTDLVFSGKAIIAEDGLILKDNSNFETQPIEVTSDIDIDKLRLDRVKCNTFQYNQNFQEDYRLITVKLNHDLHHVVPDYKKILRIINPLPFVPQDETKLKQRCEEIINIQAFGLMRRLDAIGCKKAVIGISGGLDSTLALLVTVKAFEKLNLSSNNIIGVTMPGLATSSRTKNNAKDLMNELGVTSMEISIEEAVKLHFRDINQDPEKFDITFENSQARERTQIIMDLANKVSGIVIGTGDMSELALGWCTYNGDQMSMYGVNASVPKTLVKHLVNWFANQSSGKIVTILKDICHTPISPELIPSSSDEITQKTEDLVGPYELHDFFLYNFLRNSFEPKKIYFLALKAFTGKYDEKTILKWLKIFLRRFFSQQFKRSCMPDGPKVGSVNLSPRGDWRMPSDACVDLWLDQLDQIEKDLLKN